MIELETILERGNLNRAFKAVVANKGSAGVDGMEVGDLLAYLKVQGADLVKSIKEGRYKPSPVRRVFIPKENGEKRPLGIPTVVQQVKYPVLPLSGIGLITFWHSGLKIWHCCSCGIGLSCGLDSVPSLDNSICGGGLVKK